MLGKVRDFLRSLIHRRQRLAPAVNRAVEALEGRRLLAANGLAVTYYDNIDLTGKSVSRVDATVNFDWVGGSPASGIGGDTFSARWTGQVDVKKSENVTFFTTSDDGVRLWVDGKLVINNWTRHAPKEDKATVALAAGRHDVKLEYYEEYHGAVMKLMWQSPTVGKQVIPNANLVASADPTPTPAPAPVGDGNGLLATYYDNDNFTGATVARTDRTVDFDWGGGAPAAGLGADTFSVRWTGQVLAQKTEEYTFYTNSDDGVRLWVNGVQLINNWSVHAPAENSGKIRLEAGKKYDIKMEYFERASGAVAQLKWSSPSTPKQIVPQSQLFSTPVEGPGLQGPAAPSPVVGNGNGLLATYYDNENFTGTTVARTDRTVAFDWGGGAPTAGFGADTFSARWTGQVMAQRTEEYTFYTQSDDGVRLWVNGVKLVDNWSVHAPTENSGKIRLEAGKKYDIKMEYFERSAGAVAQLKWSSPNTGKQIVPQAQLFSATPVNQPSPVEPTPVPNPTPNPTPGNVNGLLGTYYKNTDFTGSSITRYDNQLAFDWGTSSPHEVVGSDGWTARWTGQVQVNKSENVNFHITSQGGARLWVDGKLVIDDWAQHGKREVGGSAYLTAGRHDIKLEFADRGGQAVMQLRWSSPSIAKQYIPANSLFASKPVYPDLGLPAAAPFTGYKVNTNNQVNFRPGNANDKSLVVDGYRISNIPIDHKGLNIAVTDLVPGQKAFAYRNITVRNTEISGVYRTPGYHNDFIRIAGAAGRQDVPMNITLENIKIHDGQAIPILITDGDYDTIIIRNVQIYGTTVNQLQINTQNVGTVKRIIVENSPGLSVAITGKVGTIGEAIVVNSPNARVSDGVNKQGTKSGVKITVLP